MQPSKGDDSSSGQMSEVLLPQPVLVGDDSAGNSMAAQGGSPVQSLAAGRASALLSSLVWSWSASFASPVFCLAALNPCAVPVCLESC